MLYEIFRLWESCPVRLRGMQNPCSRSVLARGIMLMAENNAEYDPMIYEREEAANVRILGEAVAFIRAV